MTGKRKWISLVSVVVFFIFTIGIYAPYELYLSNTTEFWFTLSQFWWLPVLFSLACAAILILIGALLRKNAYLAYLGILFGVALATYLQGNFLGLDLGPLTGSNINWIDYKWDVFFNAAVWILCIAASVAAVFCIKKHGTTVVSCASMLFTAMQLCALVIMLLNVPAESDASGEPKFISDKNLYTVGSEENIVVLLLDMFDDHYFREILESEPEIANQLDGFTYFTNNTGTYTATMYSVASLLSGSYINPALQQCDTFAAMIEEAYTNNPYLDELHDAGYSVNLYTYGDLPSSSALEIASNYINGDTYIASNVVFTKTLYRLVATKYLPDIVKPFVWLGGTEFNDMKATDTNGYEPYSTNNTWFYDGLKENNLTVSSDTEKMFKFIHINGPHPPYEVGADGEAIEPTSDPSYAIPCARGSLTIALQYLNRLKEIGMYDNTSIIIMADHGLCPDGHLSSPIFLAKPANSTGTRTASNAPVCQMDFDATVLGFAGLNEDESYGRSAFDFAEGEERERLYYEYYLEEPNHSIMWRQIEFSISSESNARESYTLTGREILHDGTVISHKEHCVYCQSGETAPIETDENWPVTVIHYSDLPEYQWE